MNLDHLNPKLIESICLRLSTLEGSLKGLAALFKQGANDSCFEADELFGLGQLLDGLSQESARLEDILSSGRDSIARNEILEDE